MVETQLDVLYGDERDEYIRACRAKADAFFAQAGTENLEVYRIEQFEPIRQPAEHHGKFYDGDSYVVLKLNEKAWDIHYWHGVDCTSVSFCSFHAVKHCLCTGRNGFICRSLSAAL